MLWLKGTLDFFIFYHFYIELCYFQSSIVSIVTLLGLLTDCKKTPPLYIYTSINIYKYINIYIHIYFIYIYTYTYCLFYIETPANTNTDILDENDTCISNAVSVSSRKCSIWYYFGIAQYHF